MPSPGRCRWPPSPSSTGDLAAPGLRVHDLAHVCWTFTGIGPEADRATIIWWQERCRRGITEQADRGEPGSRALRDRGVIEEIRAQEDWTRQNLLSYGQPG
jgi:hypothetical protein